MCAAARKGPAGISTIGIHGGYSDDQPGAPVVPPIVQSATFMGGANRTDAILYTRYGNNPLQLSVGQKVAALEGAPAGLILGSGMAAIAMTILANANSGDHIVASAHLYGATRALFEKELPKRGIKTTFVDAMDGKAWRRAIRKRTRLIYIEGPTNPTLRLIDPRPIAELAREHGIPLVMDATFATPANMRPREFGVDLVVHSATKYMGGHSDLIAGCVVGDEEAVRAIDMTARLYGPAADPHMVWLLDRGLRTLDVRMERHNRNAGALADWLEAHPRIRAVHYPGLESHPDHALAAEIMKGFGGMVSFVVKGGGKAAGRFMSKLRVAKAAPSLGGVETLVSQPRYTSHAAMTRAQRAEQGIPDGFIRFSVGVENIEDLKADMDQALRS